MEIGQVLNYLQGRGHNVGQTAVGLYGSYYQVDAMGCSEEKVRLFARLESWKDNGATCDGDSLAYMAELCKEITEDASLDSRSADEARDLATRVAKLQNPPTDPPLSESEIQQLTPQANVLKIRMAHLLTREFRRLC